ncbi:rod shape-determining protein MreC [Alkalisalibacterium limincola]|uniref:Cell shape-determining protein MreC n=1 Tax=Alkalisalibacterium limincola TaxID=2699169 RepID=A0A5C8KH83_9GAMM|nr:rod shape-determining protein MreC [Alkalisalibacterium limincola]
MVYAGLSSSNRSSDSSVGILGLLAYLGAAVVLMVVDHRGDWLSEVRRQAGSVVAPLYWVASSPVRLATTGYEQFASRQRLNEENAQLRENLLVANARLYRLEAVANENQRLRELLGGTRGYQLDVQLASILDIDLDPFRHRVVLDQGARQGVNVGQAMIDAGGLAGQVTDVQPHRSTALLITDPDHAVPVQVVRSGLRLIAYGTGRSDVIEVRNIPQSGDIEAGDVLVTSGIGGGFPAGFPVGTITSLRPDATQTFLEADARPASAAARSGEVLLVSTSELVDSAVAVAGPPREGDDHVEAEDDEDSGP